MQYFEVEADKNKKGRSFRALCLASVEADPLWEGGGTSTETRRPVWAMFAGTDTELRPFAMNLRLGRKLREQKEKMEFLKTARYEHVWQREEEGSILTVFLPDLFRMDPGMIDPDFVRFLLLPSRSWAAEQALDTDRLLSYGMSLGLPVAEEKLRELLPVAYLFATYLDRRVRCPLVADGRFYVQVFLQALSEGLASWPVSRRSYGSGEFGEHGRHGLVVDGCEGVGLLTPVAVSGRQSDVEKFLAEQVQDFFRRTR